MQWSAVQSQACKMALTLWQSRSYYIICKLSREAERATQKVLNSGREPARTSHPSLMARLPIIDIAPYSKCRATSNALHNACVEYGLVLYQEVTAQGPPMRMVMSGLSMCQMTQGMKQDPTSMIGQHRFHRRDVRPQPPRHHMKSRKIGLLNTATSRQIGLATTLAVQAAS